MAGNQEERSASSTLEIGEGILSSLLECPVCFSHILPPIYQCPNGHLVCEDCRTEIDCCPTCRGDAPTIRCLVMEKVAANLKVPCKNAGCPELINYTDKAEHEENCSWQGSYSQIVKCIKDWDKTRLRWLSFLGHKFLFVVQIKEKCENIKEYFAKVNFIGSPENAQKFRYLLELEGNGRSLTWKGMPNPCPDLGGSLPLVVRDRMLFDTSTIQLLTDGNGLSPSITVKITQKSNPTNNIIKIYPLFKLLS